MSKKTLSCLIAISLISISGFSTLLFAETITWIGVTNNWSEPTNWSTGTVPQATDDVIFDGTSVRDSYIDAGFNGTIASIVINDGYTGRIWQQRSFIITGDYSQFSGIFNSPPNLPFSVGQSFSVLGPGPEPDVHPVGFGRTTGIGTIGDPILIYDIYGLQTAAFSAAIYYKLNNDIDASCTINWREGRGFSPIGGSVDTGTTRGPLDGGGHTISNLFINVTDPSQTNVGLFGYACGISNLGLINCSITGPGNTGSLAGFNYGVISNCYSVGGNVSGLFFANYGIPHVGGLVGRNQGIISGSYNAGSVSGVMNVGGLVGLNISTVSDSYNTGVIGSASGYDIGGLVSQNYGTITGSYNTGSVSCYDSAGGLVSENYNIISDCYNTGDISTVEPNNYNSVGGLVGWNKGAPAVISNSYNAGTISGVARYAGGLVGWNYLSAKIYNSYNVGIVSSGGGFVGYNYKGTISNCGWWTGAATYPGTVYGVLIYNESDRNAFTNPNHGIYTVSAPTWDFNSIWEIYTAEPSFPILWWQAPPGSWALNMTDMNWYENTVPYSSTGAASCQMILNYIRAGAGQALLTQNEIYEYGKSPSTYGPELTPDEVNKTLGHFDPYDSLVSNWADSYDTVPSGNPYQGYNYTIDTYDPNVDTDAINKYMRDICHWMAYTVTKEDWWLDGELVAKPNTPAAVPIYGSYSNWVAVKGCATSANPAPEPHINPWNTPDFTVYGFWMKDPKVNGIGQNTYKTAAECRSTYFLPLVTNDAYDGLFLQIAEPPAEISGARVDINTPSADPANLDFIKIGTAPYSSSVAAASTSVSSKPQVMKQSWRDLVDPRLLTDHEAVSAFEGTLMGKSIFVDRADEGADYYLVPFLKPAKGKFLVSAVIVLDASEGYFKEASWTDKPTGELLKVDEKEAIRLVRNRITRDFSEELKNLPKNPAKAYLLRRIELLRRYNLLLTGIKDAKTSLIWQPTSYSSSPYRPYWKVTINNRLWYVTQDMKVIP